MHCSNCGAAVADSARYCSHCGAETENHATSSWLPSGAAKPIGKIINEPPPTGGETPHEVPPKPPVPTSNKSDHNVLIGGLSLGCALVIVIVPIYLLLSWCSGPSETPEQVKAEQAKSLEDERNGFHCLSAWDGSNRSFVEQVKRQLRDPDSFEMVETRIAPVVDGQHLITMEYRAKNGFGGMNVAIATGTVDHASCNATVASIGE
jgi:hypothetical protein